MSINLFAKNAAQSASKFAPNEVAKISERENLISLFENLGGYTEKHTIKVHEGKFVNQDNVILEGVEITGENGQLIEAKELPSDWQETHNVEVRGINLLEGAKNQLEKEYLAIMHQNHLIDSAKAHGKTLDNYVSQLVETTQSSSVASYEVVGFGMVRRVWAKTLAKELVHVMAMTAPSMNIIYFNPKISRRVIGQDNLGRETQSHTPPKSAILDCISGANCSVTTFSDDTCRSLYDRFYGDENYDFSKGKITIITATGEPVIRDRANSCYVSASTIPFGNDGTIRSIKFRVGGLFGYNTGTNKQHTTRLQPTSNVGIEIDSLEFLSSLTVINVGAPILDPYGNVIYDTNAVIDYNFPATPYAKPFTTYADFCEDDGSFIVELNLAQPFSDCTQCPTADNFIGAASGTTFAPQDLAFAWRRYTELEAESELGEVTIEPEKIVMTATTRKLRAVWTPESIADFQAYHNIDIEAELTALMSEHIALEIDREILRDLKRGAAWRLNWDYYGWKSGSASIQYDQKRWNQTLITRVNQISQQIHRATLRGGATFLVVSPEVSAVFADLDYYDVSNAQAGQDTYNLGMRRAGTIQGLYEVFVDPYAPANTVLVGRKGSSDMMDVGYIYAPYTPVVLSPTVISPNDFTNARQISTRYGKQMVNNKYFGVINCFNLVQFDRADLA